MSSNKKDTENFIEQDDEAEFVYDETDGRATDQVKKLKEQLKACKQERQEFLDGWQRAQADFQNLKKRSAESSAGANDRAIANFVFDLLPTLDSFDMAFKDKQAWEQAPEQWRKGIEYIYTQLSNLIESYGVQKIQPVGQPFDHHEHNSIEMVPVDDQSQDHIVQEVLLCGYKLKDSVIRPANVKVGSFSEEA